MTVEALQDTLKARNKLPTKDGLRVVDLMRGRRLEEQEDDRELLTLFKKGWRINISQLEKRLSPTVANRQERKGMYRIKALQQAGAKFKQ